MAVEGLSIERRAPYLDGREFGETGAYERIDGLLTFAVDPDHPANDAIVDLRLAPRDADGKVRFQSDFCLAASLAISYLADDDHTPSNAVAFDGPDIGIEGS